jgi:hypothetical protein
MDYTELFNTIKSYCENDFAAAVFTSEDNATPVVIPSAEQVNTFIKQAEQRIYNVSTPPIVKHNVYGRLDQGNKYLNLPEDFLSVFSLAVLTDTTAGEDSPQEYLLNKDVSFIRQSYPVPTEAGVPRYYALFGPNSGSNVPDPNVTYTLIVGPTPDDNYQVELHYFRYPESIVTAGTSWLGNNFDTVLLYGALLEAIVYMKGEQDIVTYYKNRYDEAVMMYRQLTDGKERRDAYRSGQLRVPPA